MIQNKMQENNKGRNAEKVYTGYQNPTDGIRAEPGCSQGPTVKRYQNLDRSEVRTTTYKII